VQSFISNSLLLFEDYAKEITPDLWEFKSRRKGEATKLNPNNMKLCILLPCNVVGAFAIMSYFNLYITFFFFGTFTLLVFVVVELKHVYWFCFIYMYIFRFQGNCQLETNPEVVRLIGTYGGIVQACPSLFGIVSKDHCIV